MSTHNYSSSETHSEKDSSNRTAEEVRKAFAALPFEQKISTLIRVELDMLGDAVNTVAAAASRAADEIVNACTGPEPNPSEGPGASGGAKI